MAYAYSDYLRHDILRMIPPDGKRIAFDSRKFGHADIFVVTADGGEPQRITSSASIGVDVSVAERGRSISSCICTA